MKKRHVNEFMRSKICTGRVAGTGITEDNYDDESCGRCKPLNYQKQPAFEHKEKQEHGEVTIRYKEEV